MLIWYFSFRTFQQVSLFSFSFFNRRNDFSRKFDCISSFKDLLTPLLSNACNSNCSSIYCLHNHRCCILLTLFILEQLHNLILVWIMKTKAFTKEKKSGKFIKARRCSLSCRQKLQCSINEKKKRSSSPLPIPSMSFKYTQFL